MNRLQGRGVRSRPVGRDFKAKGDKDRADLFASTPPLDGRGADRCQQGPLERQDQVGGWRPLHHAAREDGWRLREAKAVAVRYETCSPRLGIGGHGSRQGSADHVPQCGNTGTRCVVHGDDFTPVGPRKDLQRMTQLIKAWYQLKVRAALGKWSKRRQGNIVAQQVGQVKV